jgi:glycosyltransferase involved in cell wall biosynthesis
LVKLNITSREDLGVMQNQLKIACYGNTRKDAASGTGATYLILEELLDRGFNIDFYGWKNFNYPSGLLAYKNFNFIDLPEKSLIQKFERFVKAQSSAKFLSVFFSIIHYLIALPIDRRTLRQAMQYRHKKRNYDLILLLDVYAYIKITQVPVISWVQGPPQSEQAYYKKSWKWLFRTKQLSLYLMAMVYYAIEMTKRDQVIRLSDLVICSSPWSESQLMAYRIQPKAIKVIPYPIDLRKFYPSTNKFQVKQSKRKITFLWLGRIELRKRFDLLIEAYRLLLQERDDIHLKVIGNFRHADQYIQIIQELSELGNLEYHASIDRDAIPALLNQSDCLVQTSEDENFGFSVVEALACGLPVILGPTNGVKAYISNLSFIFEEYTVESVKATMIKAIDALHQQSTAEIAAVTRSSAERYFDVKHTVNHLEDCFEQVRQSDKVPFIGQP